MSLFTVDYQTLSYHPLFMGVVLEHAFIDTG
jgi:hypothetical protein